MKFGFAGLFLWGADACAFYAYPPALRCISGDPFGKESPEDAAAIGAVYTSRFQNSSSSRLQLAIRMGLSYLCPLKWYESCWKTNPHNELPYRNLANLV